jgi:vancomycin resistance protein YoaR
VLKGLNQLWKLQLSNEKLSELAAQIGSDVPFFIYGGTCIARGRGEIITPLKEKCPPMHLAFIVPPVRDEELKNMGIREVVTVGESVFSKSPVNRRHNIKVGVGKFNGHLIPKDAIFSFDETLGPVNAVTGFRKELVIQGDTTLPDYGGGLCQVSTTAFRGPWEYGMPIVQRKNHSYAVSYYSPQGTDATIYPPNVDMKFKNDTPGALLIQSFVDDFDQAFFIYYGTRDNRKTDVYGPYISDRVGAPKEERTVFTTEIPVGERRKAGERHDGMKALWYRSIAYEGTGAVLRDRNTTVSNVPVTSVTALSETIISRVSRFLKRNCLRIGMIEAGSVEANTAPSKIATGTEIVKLNR